MKPIAPNGEILALLKKLPKPDQEILVSRYMQTIDMGIHALAMTEMERDDILEFERLLEEDDLKRPIEFLASRIENFGQKLDTLIAKVSVAFTTDLKESTKLYHE